MSPSVRYLVGDTRDMIADLPGGSVSLVASSPPFVALRSYLPADHPMKHAEIGSEPDPATFIDTLLALTAEWGRVLAPWGSIAIELGDTYAGGGQGPDPGKHDAKCEVVTIAQSHGANWPRPKCLALVPQAYALSLAYGRNVLNGNESPAGQWLVRNVLVWHRPNPAVGALGDKFRPSTSYIVVATRSARRWFDLTAVRGPSHPENERSTLAADGKSDRFTLRTATGAPPLDAWFDQHDTWTITTQPSSLAHYAMWPPRLAERLILSMCPAEVCSVCGEPRRRVEKSTPSVDGIVGKIVGFSNGLNATHGDYEQVGGTFATCKETLGWTDCGHDAFIPGTVLDPFAGTGTTLAVANCHGRDAIGIDIDERNRDLFAARLDEVRKTLHGVKPQLSGQLDIFNQQREDNR